MLILIPGITGMVGTPTAYAAIKAGHQVRGMGRDEGKVEPKLLEQLESFFQIESLYDIPALDRGVQGVDAVIYAGTYSPGSILEGQLLLLRSAEKAGIKIFHAGSWNYDWTKMKFGDHEIYNAMISFHEQVVKTSPIKPIYMFTGAIMEFFFNAPAPLNPLDKEAETMSYYGDGTEQLIYTTVDDLAAYTIAAVTAPDAEKGGYLYVESFKATYPQLAEIYNSVRNANFKLNVLGTKEDIENELAEARATTEYKMYHLYIAKAYMAYILGQTPGWTYEAKDSERFSQVKQTGFDEWLELHPEI